MSLLFDRIIAYYAEWTEGANLIVEIMYLVRSS